LICRLQGLGSESNADAAVFSCDGNQFAASSAPVEREKTILIWNTVTGKLTHTLSAPVGSVSPVTVRMGGLRLVAGSQALAFSTDGMRLASAGEDHNAIIWDIQTNRALFHLVHSYECIDALIFTENGSQLATVNSSMNGSRVGPITFWDTITGKIIHTNLYEF
jgi:WD40 repeat protein